MKEQLEIRNCDINYIRIEILIRNIEGQFSHLLEINRRRLLINEAFFNRISLIIVILFLMNFSMIKQTWNEQFLMKNSKNGSNQTHLSLM